MLSNGISEKQIVVVGPMKYAGFQFEYEKTNVLSKIGIVFDGWIISRIT